MPIATNATTAQPDPTCDPHQHAHDEKAFVEMVTLCAVLWVGWRIFRRWRDRNSIPKIHRRPPGA